MTVERIEKIAIICTLISVIVASLIFITGQQMYSHTNNTNNYNTNINSTNNMVSNVSTNVVKNVCEGCHMSGKGYIPQATTVKPHINGGIYCLSCHNFSHVTHPTSGIVTCENCHGSKNETIPVSGPNIVCINCHDYPNPLNKSFGNLLTIHRPREINCTNCHTDRCTKCHSDVINDERWEKRLNHFRAILGKSFLS